MTRKAPTAPPSDGVKPTPPPAPPLKSCSASCAPLIHQEELCALYNAATILRAGMLASKTLRTKTARTLEGLLYRSRVVIGS